jgi:hypothetical protein
LLPTSWLRRRRLGRLEWSVVGRRLVLGPPHATRSRLIVEGDELVSTVNGKRYGIGTLSMPTLAEPRNRVEVCPQQRSTVRCVTNEARAMHADPPLEGALVQVASQFNL